MGDSLPGLQARLMSQALEADRIVHNPIPALSSSIRFAKRLA